ncbi:MAG TPA: hypothetical protein VNW94_05630, partial [Streptosporangiaceae bacterium]|nr:hypothetical protein [Streptosporangiaceae bacterium]
MADRGFKVAAVLVLAAAAGSAAWALRSPAPPRTPAGIPAGTAPVVRADVAERQQVNGTLGHSGTYDVIAPGGTG